MSFVPPRNQEQHNNPLTSWLGKGTVQIISFFFFSPGKLRHLKRKRKRKEICKAKNFYRKLGAIRQQQFILPSPIRHDRTSRITWPRQPFPASTQYKKTPTHLKETNKKCRIIPGHKYKLGLQKETRYLDSRNEEGFHKTRS